MATEFSLKSRSQNNNSIVNIFNRKGKLNAFYYLSLAKELVHHLNYAILAKAHTQMYLMHKWWARKPHNVVHDYIERYTSKGDIILDPFCGSGVTPIEAIKMGRKAIGVDLDPIATFITQMTARPIQLKSIHTTLNEIKNSISKQILSYYMTVCPQCQSEQPLICSIWEAENKKPIELRIFCEKCDEYVHKKPDLIDIGKLEKIQAEKIPYWYPEVRLRYNGEGFLKREKAETLDDLFTKRNLICLSILFNEINKIKDKDIRELFCFGFTSMLHLASKMTPDRPSRPYSSFWALQSFWMPPKNMESNVWALFENAIAGKQGLVVGKEDSNSQIKQFREVKDFTELKTKSDANFLVLNQSSLDLSNIESDSIDYVFTDPPYGGAVQYFELSTLWCAWLNQKGDFCLDYNGEITINPQQHKDFDYYHKMLHSAFREIYRVLRPTKYMTVTFHNTDIKIYNSVIRACVIAGFDIEKIVYQPPARPSAKQLLQPQGSAIGDYYIRFKKPLTTRKQVSEEEIDKENFSRIITESIKKILAERGEPTTYSIIINSYAEIYQKLKDSGYLFSASKGLNDILRERLNKDFVLKNGKWWFKDESVVRHIQNVPLNERVESAVITVLYKKIKVSFDEILQEIFIQFPNALTPETSSIMSVLKEYAEPKNGKWLLKAGIQQDYSMHDQMVEYLAILGKKLGFGVHADIDKWRDYDFPFSNKIPKEKLDRIKEIDCVWFDKNRILYDFEVEHSTGITEAIVRGSNIPYSTKKFIIIPESRERKLAQKISEPLIKEKLKTDNWSFIRYNDFLSYYEKNKNKKKISVKELEKLNKHPNPPRQTDMSDFFS